MQRDGATPTAGEQTEPDGQGNTVSLEQYNDTDFGFLRIKVNATEITVDALGVKSPTTTTSPTEPITAPVSLDSFTIDLATHVVTTASTVVKKKKPVKKGPVKKHRVKRHR